MKKLLMLGLLLAFEAAGADLDAPYVMRTADGKFEAWTVEQAAEGPKKRVAAISTGGKFTVGAVGNIPAFEVTLRPPPPTASDSVKTRARAPLFVVADTHG